jgi:hypothetical protein
VVPGSAQTLRGHWQAGVRVAVFDVNAEVGEKTAKEIGGLYVM